MPLERLRSRRWDGVGPGVSRTADNTQSVFELRAAQRASQLGAMTMSLEVKTRKDTEHWPGESAETLQRK